MVKNPLAMWETWVQSLGWEDPLEKERLPLQDSGLENSIDCIVHGVTKSRTRLSDFHSFYFNYTLIKNTKSKTQTVNLQLV